MFLFAESSTVESVVATKMLFSFKLEASDTEIGVVVAVPLTAVLVFCGEDAGVKVEIGAEETETGEDDETEPVEREAVKFPGLTT